MSQEEIDLWHLHMRKVGYSLYGQLTSNSSDKQFLVVPGEYLNSWQFEQKLGALPIPFTDDRVKSFMSPTVSQIKRIEEMYTARIHLGFYTQDKEGRYIGQVGQNYETKQEVFHPSEHVSVDLWGHYYPGNSANRLTWTGVANLQGLIAELGSMVPTEEIKPQDGVAGEMTRLYFWQLKKLLGF